MCKLDKLNRIVDIAIDMYPGTAISISPLFKHERKLQCLMNGRIVFDPITNRRHAWDIMVHYNLYVKRVYGDMWECGVHGDGQDTVISNSPLKSITEYAFTYCLK